MVPAMFSFEIWKIVAKKYSKVEAVVQKKYSKVVAATTSKVMAVLEAAAELFNNKVKRHVSVSAEDA